MPIWIEEDFDQADGGYAILTLPKSIGDSDGSLRIRRLSGEPDKLGPKGWQPHDAVLKPLSVRESAGRVALYFGPELTRHLIEDTELEISVLALGSPERVIWPYITPSAHADRGRGSVVGKAPKTDIDVKFESQDGSPADDTDGPIATTIDPPAPPDVGDDDRDTDEPDKPGFNWLWLLPLVAVAAVVSFLFLPANTDPPPDPTSPDETHATTEPVVSDEPSTQEAERAVTEELSPVEGDTRESLTAEAESCIEIGCDGDAFMDIATRLGAIGVGDLFAIMGLAADNGSVEAMEWLARSYDPLHFEPNEGLSNPDVESAFLYYAQAEEAGSDLAMPAREALCAAIASPGDATWNTPPPEDDTRAALERNCQ